MFVSSVRVRFARLHGYTCCNHYICSAFSWLEWAFTPTLRLEMLLLYYIQIRLDTTQFTILSTRSVWHQSILKDLLAMRQTQSIQSKIENPCSFLCLQMEAHTTARSGIGEPGKNPDWACLNIGDTLKKGIGLLLASLVKPLFQDANSNGARRCKLAARVVKQGTPTNSGALVSLLKRPKKGDASKTGTESDD